MTLFWYAVNEILRTTRTFYLWVFLQLECMLSTLGHETGSGVGEHRSDWGLMLFNQSIWYQEEEIYKVNTLMSWPLLGTHPEVGFIRQLMLYERETHTKAVVMLREMKSSWTTSDTFSDWHIVTGHTTAQVSSLVWVPLKNILLYFSGCFTMGPQR